MELAPIPAKEVVEQFIDLIKPIRHKPSEWHVGIAVNGNYDRGVPYTGRIVRRRLTTDDAWRVMRALLKYGCDDKPVEDRPSGVYVYASLKENNRK